MTCKKIVVSWCGCNLSEFGGICAHMSLLRYFQIPTCEISDSGSYKAGADQRDPEPTEVLNEIRKHRGIDPGHG